MDSKQLRTAIVIMAPHAVQAIASPIALQYCFESFIRVPAHITVLYPFVLFDELEDACQKLEDICAEVQPFDITLEGYGFFPTVAYMKPLPAEPVQQLFGKVFAKYPDYPPYRGAFGNEIVPHLTVGEFDSPSDLQNTNFPAYAPVSFRADRIHIIYGMDKQTVPWVTYDVIRLG